MIKRSYQKYRKVLSFLFVGGITFLLGAAIMYVGVELANWYLWFANVVQLAVTFWVNYKMNSRITFQTTGHSVFVRFLVTRVVTLTIVFLLFNGFIAGGAYFFGFIPDDGTFYLVANALSVLIGTFLNYFAADRLVFVDSVVPSRMRDLEDLRLTRRTGYYALTGLAIVCIALWSVSGLNLFLGLAVTIFALMSLGLGILFLCSQLYTERYHGADEDLSLRKPLGVFVHDFAVLMPARHETDVLAGTIINAVWTQRHHPNHRFLPIVCDDDPDTMRVALCAARVARYRFNANGDCLDRDLLEQQLSIELEQLNRNRPIGTPTTVWTRFAGKYLYGTPLVKLSSRPAPLTPDELAEIERYRKCDDLVQPVVFPLEGRKPNKPLQLNYTFRLYTKRFSAYTILDAESLAADGLLTHVDQAFQDHPEADIIQGGVQLMEPQFSGSRKNRLKQYFLRWFSWHNLLEYSRWFMNQMRFQSDADFVPLGGNTVFMLTGMLLKTDGWPETLTEDCALGTLATAVYGAKTFTFYDPALATLEETPPRLSELIKQRVRWNQGFLQTFLGGQWRALPTMRQRMLALWILSMSFFQAITIPLVLLTFVTIVWVDSPAPLVLVMYLPLAVLGLSLLLQVMQLRTFSTAFNRRVPWHVYVLLMVTFLPYQFVLAYAAFKAVQRHIKGETSWHRTERSGGENLGQAPAQLTKTS